MFFPPVTVLFWLHLHGEMAEGDGCDFHSVARRDFAQEAAHNRTNPST